MSHRSLKWRVHCFAIVLCVGFVEHAHCQSLVTPRNPNVDRHELSEGFRRSVEPVMPAIVTVEVLRGPRTMPPWKQEKLPAAEDIPSESNDFPHDGTGSGIIFDRRGYVLTCHHVVESSDTVFVRLGDGRRFESIAILADPVTDLAVIQIPSEEPIPVAPIGDSDKLQLGDWVASIGNPYELGLSISAGVVSATDRHLPSSPRTHLLQTDAASNPGNSGGALVNLQGQVVGISEGGYGIHEGFQGIGFAIPINAAIRTAHRLIKEGGVAHARLDFDTEPLETKVADFLGLQPDDGLLVCSVVPNSPAEVAGVVVGDVVTHIAGTPMHKSCDIVTAIEKAVPGQPLPVTLFRAGTSISIELIPESLENTASFSIQSSTNQQTAGFADLQNELTVDEVSAAEIKKLGFKKLSSGVVITSVSPGGIAAKEGLCAGMMVMSAGNEPVTSLDDYQKATKASRNLKGVLMLIATPQQQHFVLLQK